MHRIRAQALLLEGDASAQAVPLYLSEIAPPMMRGLLNQLFQLATTVGEAAPTSTVCTECICTGF